MHQRELNTATPALAELLVVQHVRKVDINKWMWDCDALRKCSEKCLKATKVQNNNTFKIIF